MSPSSARNRSPGPSRAGHHQRYVSWWGKWRVYLSLVLGHGDCSSDGLWETIDFLAYDFGVRALDPRLISLVIWRNAQQENVCPDRGGRDKGGRQGGVFILVCGRWGLYVRMQECDSTQVYWACSLEVASAPGGTGEYEFQWRKEQ